MTGTKDKFISPDMINRLNRATDELNELIRLIKEDSMTFDHLCSYDYWTKLVIPTYKSNLNIKKVKLLDIRVVHDNIVDIETNMFIVTFHRKSEEEGIESRTYHIVNDIDILADTVAEVELESGYMDECRIYPLANTNKFHFILDTL